MVAIVNLRSTCLEVLLTLGSCSSLINVTLTMDTVHKRIVRPFLSPATIVAERLCFYKHLSFCPSGSGVSARHPTLNQGRHPPDQTQTPPGKTPPGRRPSRPEADTPIPEADTPWADTPQADTSLQADTPGQTPPRQTHPSRQTPTKADTPLGQTPPG